MDTTKQQGQQDEIEIDLVELFGVIWHKAWLILLCGINLALLTFLVSNYLLIPKYESITKLYIINRQSNESLTYSDLQSGAQLTKDYKELVVSRPVLEEVISELNLDLENDELAEMISVEIPTDTRIVTITVEDTDPYMARSIADAVRVSASKHIGNVMNTEAVNVVEEANLPIEQSSPNVLLNTAIGGIVGAFLAVAVVVLIYVLDDTLKNPDDIEHYLGYSVLASIPLAEDEQKTKKKASRNRKSSSHKHTQPVRQPIQSVKQPVQPVRQPVNTKKA